MKPSIVNAVDYLYFNIYNYFYRISLDRHHVNPRMQAMYLFSLGSGGWLLLLESIYLHFIRHVRFTSRGQSMLFAGSIYMLTALLFHYIFIVKDRDQKIVDKFEQQSEAKPAPVWHLYLALGFLAIPYLTMMGFALFLPRHVV